MFYYFIHDLTDKLSSPHFNTQTNLCANILSPPIKYLQSHNERLLLMTCRAISFYYQSTILYTSIYIPPHLQSIHSRKFNFKEMDRDLFFIFYASEDSIEMPEDTEPLVGEEIPCCSTNPRR